MSYQQQQQPNQSFCSFVMQLVQSNPFLVQALQQRPDILQMIRGRCGGLFMRTPPRRPHPQYPQRPRPTIPRGPPQTIPPSPQPTPGPASGCGYGKRFDSCGCRCVDKNAVTPQCIRNCTQCGVDQVFNWCVMKCVPKMSKIKQCPPLE